MALETSAEDHLTFWRERRARAQNAAEYERLNSFIYVLRGKEESPIKIGMATDPLGRMASVQTGCWERLRLLYVVPGAHKLERAFHKRLSTARLEGEWFNGPAIESFLEWLGDYTREAVATYMPDRKLPPVPDFSEIVVNRSGFGANWNAKLGHRWRTKPDSEAPVTVRFVEPSPRAADEIASRKQERERNRHVRANSDTWYPGKEAA